MMLAMVEVPHVALFTRLVAGAILLAAGVAKVGDHRRFTDVVKNYQLLPAVPARLVGRALPVVEVVIGASLLVGVLLPWAAFIAAGLFLMFGAAVAINLLRGRRAIDCGCFGSAHRQHLSWALVLRNALLIGLAGAASGGPVAMGWPWAAMAAPGVATHLVVADTVATIIAAGAAISIWWLAEALGPLMRPAFEEGGG